MQYSWDALQPLRRTLPRLDGLTVSQGAPELAGAVVSPQQAVGLCTLFGLVVKG